MSSSDWKKLGAVAVVAGGALGVASAFTGKRYTGLHTLIVVVVVATWLGGGGAAGAGVPLKR